MAIVIPRSSARKLALLCAEANSLRKTIAGLGSSVLKFDSALQNTLNTIIDACNQFDKGVELAKTAGDLVLDTINGATTTAKNIQGVINQGVTKLPFLPLPVSSEIGTLLDQVVNTEFGQINTDLLIDQLISASPQAFQNVIFKINRIPEDLRTLQDKSVDALAKTIDFNSILNSTTSSLRKKAIACIRAGSKEKLSNTNSLLAQDTQNILTDINNGSRTNSINSN